MADTPLDPAAVERPDLHELGRLKERSLIVKWLMDWAYENNSYSVGYMAQAIERLDHLKDRPDDT